MAAVAIGAVIPTGTRNHPEYFACHPELFVQLLGAGLALGPELDPEFRRTRQLLVAWLMQQKLRADRPPARSRRERKRGKLLSGMARLTVDGMESGKAYYSIHANRQHVIVTPNGMLLTGDQATLYIAGTPYRLKYTGTA